MEIIMCVEISLGIQEAVNCNLLISTRTQEFAEKIENNPEKSRLHYLWIVPVNLANSIIGIAVAPIAFTINVLAAIVLKLGSLCFKSNNANEMARLFSVLAAAQLDAPLTLISRIFVPTSEVHPITNWYAESIAIEE
jgi:hypothetical protein